MWEKGSFVTCFEFDRNHLYMHTSTNYDYSGSYCFHGSLRPLKQTYGLNMNYE